MSTEGPRPIQLSLLQACRIIWLVEDLAGARKLSPDEDDILLPLASQIELIHAQLHDVFGHPGRPDPVDKSGGTLNQ